MRNLKRALSLALASVMLVGLMVVGTGAASYTDVDAVDNLEAIEVLKAVGVMTGDENGNFNPDKTVTRNEMAVIMANLLDLKTGGNTPFTDVPAWAAPYVAACYNNNIIAGVSKTTFGGDQTVTAAQASLMLMKALGYFGYQGEFGDDWQLSTIKQANKIDLFDGISANATTALTRNDVAQLGLNALESTMIIVEQQGGMSVDGNGMSVVVNPTYKYDPVVNRSGKDYGDGAMATMELVEKLYSNDLKKNTDTNDSFGRPATQWTYETSTITTPKAPELSYTKAVKGKAIYEDLGKINGVTIDNGTAGKVTVDGKNDTLANNGMTGLAITSGNNVEIGGKGTVTEVYYDKDTKKATIVQMNTYLAEADEDFDADDEEVNITVHTDKTISDSTLSGDDFAVANVDEKDYLLVNLAYDGTNYAVKGVSFPEIIEDVTVSAARDGDYVTAGGTKYEYNTVAKTASSSALGQALMAGSGYTLNKDSYNLYLDNSGYVVGVKGYDAGVNLDNYLFVKKTGTTAFDGMAQVVFMDGTSKTVTVDKLTKTDGTTVDIDKDNIDTVGNVDEDKFYKFDTDKDGNYELTAIATTTTGTKVEQGNKTSAITSAAKPIVGAPAGNSSTVFVAKDKVYTGVKNAPEVASSTVYYMTNDKGILMAVYTGTAGSSKTSSDELVYVLDTKPAKSKDGDTTYYTYNAIVKGEKATVDTILSSVGSVGTYKINTYSDGRVDDWDLIADDGSTEPLVHYLGDIQAAGGASYSDGTVTLGASSYILADDAKIFTIDGNTVKTISASGVKKAVADGFKLATAIEVSSSDDKIATIYLSK